MTLVKANTNVSLFVTRPMPITVFIYIYIGQHTCRLQNIKLKIDSQHLKGQNIPTFLADCKAAFSFNVWYYMNVPMCLGRIQMLTTPVSITFSALSLMCWC